MEKIKKKRIKLYILIVVIILIIVSSVLVYFIKGIEEVQAPWIFISDQILGMKWLNNLIGNIIDYIAKEQVIGSVGEKIQHSIQFFLYDFIKITILLCFLIFSISYVQSYFPPERTKRILSKVKGIKGNITGALLGTVTPFCSCSSIPIFIGFTRAGLSSGITFSFLISSPLVDLGSIIILASFFGWPIALIYVVVGLILAVIGGTIIDKTGLGKNVEDFVLNGTKSIDIEDIEMTRNERLVYAKDQMITTFKKVFIYIIIGVAIGAVIHNVIPEVWIQNVLGANKWYSVLLATVLGVPMYADIFGTLPIAEALFIKGAGLGTILAFMMSVTALSLPSLIMLRKAVKPKLLIAFFGIVVTGIIIIGYLFNIIGYLFI